MGEFAECLQGISEACKFLDYPVVSGNVSFYNGTNKKNIYPTPVIGGVGLIQNLSNPINHLFKKENSIIILVGKTFGHLGQSCFIKENFSINEGYPPEVNLKNEKENGENVLSLIQKNLVLSAHDVSSGGLLVSEDQSRYLLEISADHLTRVEKNLKENNIFYELIGKTQKKYFEIENEMKLDVNYLSKINNQWYYNY